MSVLPAAGRRPVSDLGALGRTLNLAGPRRRGVRGPKIPANLGRLFRSRILSTQHMPSTAGPGRLGVLWEFQLLQGSRAGHLADGYPPSGAPSPGGTSGSGLVPGTSRLGRGSVRPLPGEESPPTTRTAGARLSRPSGRPPCSPRVRIALLRPSRRGGRGCETIPMGPRQARRSLRPRHQRPARRYRDRSHR
jgi:hypothetical protein